MYRYSAGLYKIAFYGVHFAIFYGGYKYPNIRRISPKNIILKKL